MSKKWLETIIFDSRSIQYSCNKWYNVLRDIFLLIYNIIVDIFRCNKHASTILDIMKWKEM